MSSRGRRFLGTVAGAAAGGLLLAMPVLTRAANRPVFEVEVSKVLMGTHIEARLVCDDVAKGKEALLVAFQEMERIDAALGYDAETSEIARLNRDAGIRRTRLSWETFQLLRRSVRYARRYDGLFDVSVGAMSRLWGLGTDGGVRRPSRHEIEQTLSLVRVELLSLDDSDTTAWLPRRGMTIDLGGVAKGYAVDRAVAVLRARGFDRFYLSAGGDVFASGVNAEEEPWRVGLRHPRRNGSLVASFTLRDEAVATSGDYERFEIVDGERIHHIIDPRTGEPARGCQSASVIADTVEEADVLATTLFIRGIEGNRDVEIPIDAFVVVDSAGVLSIDDTSLRTREFAEESEAARRSEVSDTEP